MWSTSQAGLQVSIVSPFLSFPFLFFFSFPKGDFQTYMLCSMTLPRKYQLASILTLPTPPLCFQTDLCGKSRPSMEQPWLPTSFNLLMFTFRALVSGSILLLSVCVCVFPPVCDPSDQWPARPHLAEGLGLPEPSPSGDWLLFGRSSNVSLRHAVSQSLTDNAVRYSARGARWWWDWSYSSLRHHCAAPRLLRVLIKIMMKRGPPCFMLVIVLISVFFTGSQRPTPSWWATWRTVPAA